MIQSRSTYNSTQHRSFRRRSIQPVTWLVQKNWSF